MEPTGATMACALAMGVAGAPAGLGDPLGRPVPAAGLLLNRVLVTAMLGLLIGLTAMEYQLISAHSLTQVLFSGQEALPELVDHAADYSVAVWR